MDMEESIYWTDQSLDLTPEPVVRKETTRIKTRRVCKFVILTVSRMGHVLFALFVFVCAQWCPIHICFVVVFLHLVYHILPVSVDCPS